MSYETMSAVTIPNMPVGPSAWLRMWQWKAHTRGASARTIASQRSPGPIVSVSYGAILGGVYVPLV